MKIGRSESDPVNRVRQARSTVDGIRSEPFVRTVWPETTLSRSMNCYGRRVCLSTYKKKSSELRRTRVISVTEDLDVQEFSHGLVSCYCIFRFCFAAPKLASFTAGGCAGHFRIDYLLSWLCVGRQVSGKHRWQTPYRSFTVKPGHVSFRSCTGVGVNFRFFTESDRKNHRAAQPEKYLKNTFDKWHALYRDWDWAEELTWRNLGNNCFITSVIYFPLTKSQ